MSRLPYGSPTDMPPSGYGYPQHPVTMPSPSEGARRSFDRLVVPSLISPPAFSPQPIGQSMPEPAASMPSPRSSYSGGSYPSSPRSQASPLSAHNSGIAMPGFDPRIHERHPPPAAGHQPAYGWAPEQQQARQMQSYSLAGGHGQHVASRVQQPSQPLGRAPSLRNTFVDRRNRHSLANGLAVSASIGSTIAYGEPVPGAHEGDRPTSATVGRAPSNSVVSSVGRRDRPDPNECRLQSCSRRAAYVATLGGMIEWCSVEHMSQGKYQPGSRPCKMCKSNPRRWNNNYCCNACENHKG